MIKLKEGQKVLDEKGNLYQIEEGDYLVEGINTDLGDDGYVDVEELFGYRELDNWFKSLPLSEWEHYLLTGRESGMINDLYDQIKKEAYKKGAYVTGLWDYFSSVTQSTLRRR